MILALNQLNLTHWNMMLTAYTELHNIMSNGAEKNITEDYTTTGMCQPLAKMLISMLDVSRDNRFAIPDLLIKEHTFSCANQFPWHGIVYNKELSSYEPCRSFPVATLDERVGSVMYSSNELKWDKKTEYGRNRWLLLNACIEDCHKRINQLSDGSDDLLPSIGHKSVQLMELSMQFLSDVRDHAINIEIDNGVHRSIKFSPKNNHLWFRLVSYPGGMMITSSVATYCFARSNFQDLFEQFSMPSFTMDCYAIQVESRDRYSEEREFCLSKYKAWIEEFKTEFQQYATTCIKDIDERQKQSKLFNELVQRLVLIKEDWHQAVYMIKNCEIQWCKDYFNLSSTIDPNNKPYRWMKYSDDFLWCCQAIKWGIKLYKREITRKSSKN